MGNNRSFRYSSRISNYVRRWNHKCCNIGYTLFCQNFSIYIDIFLSRNVPVKKSAIICRGIFYNDGSYWSGELQNPTLSRISKYNSSCKPVSPHHPNNISSDHSIFIRSYTRLVVWLQMWQSLRRMLLPCRLCSVVFIICKMAKPNKYYAIRKLHQFLHRCRWTPQFIRFRQRDRRRRR